jgi:hypothetical protein
MQAIQFEAVVNQEQAIRPPEGSRYVRDASR